MTDDTLITITGLVKQFTGAGLFRRHDVVHAVNGVDLKIPRGETLALVGESGSGKTTLGRCLLRLHEPTAGSITFDGVDLLRLRSKPLRQFRRRMQIVFQDPTGSLNPRMRVGTAVREPIEVHGLAKGHEARARVAELFREVGLDPDLADRFPHELSGGQKQRVGIARALSVQPEFVVLDEPVSALDVSVQAQVLTLLENLRRNRGLTYLVIAHDLAVVRHIAHRVAVMYLGKLVEVGSVDAVYNDPRHPYTRALLSAIPKPDPETGRARIVLDGELPSPKQLPSGCAFHTRCPHPALDERCLGTTPSLVEADGHAVSCHHSDVEWTGKTTAR